ncbi:tetratricopeptide repeat protein [Striga asiatica]|uniref:Tetratricopeptide repeat protein n=1 Tax=Striga asiatica TaxID=4170 RepID=A0A5A7RFL6_STRAF|nr:tetratricopeptide repeat protein [Striga asiatica]
MGNCQAVDMAALVIQHPNGKQERMYWPVTASEVMKTNPGHYVSLIIPLPDSGKNPVVRYTRVKLLRPHDILVLGRAYRLVTTQEVLKVVKAKRHAKIKENEPESGKNLQTRDEKQSSNSQAAEINHTVTRQGKPRSWRPSLHSISESGS